MFKLKQIRIYTILQHQNQSLKNCSTYSYYQYCHLCCNCDKCWRTLHRDHIHESDGTWCIIEILMLSKHENCTKTSSTHTYVCRRAHPVTYKQHVDVSSHWVLCVLYRGLAESKHLFIPRAFQLWHSFHMKKSTVGVSTVTNLHSEFSHC